MKVAHTLSNGTQKIYVYDRRKYYKPVKQLPKYKRLSPQVQEYIIKLSNLNVGPSRIAQFVNSMESANHFYIGEHTVANFLKSQNEPASAI